MIPQRAVATLIAVLVSLSSCTSNDTKAGMKNTITQQEASERVEQYVRDAAAALAPEPKLELSRRFDDSPCDDPTDSGPKGRVIASVVYWLNDISPDQQPVYIDMLVQWWTKHEFFVRDDGRPKDNVVLVENRQDGFRMSVQQTSVGPKRLSLGATSPCVWPNGTPEPKP